jgi:formylglycine-generating enzyme required for sulfatase activity
LLHGAADRFERHVASDMRQVASSRFTMGSGPNGPAHAYNESPRHIVELSAFQISRHAVTDELYGLFDPARAEVAARDRSKPATGVSWAEACVFALWIGAALPTEAEWEFACAAGSPGPWCCTTAAELPRHAWFCRNSDGEVHPVGTREPNGLGLFDLHGNVWEWCQDSYCSGFYAVAPRVDPLCLPDHLSTGVPAPADRVTRGGSMHAHDDMCRNSYRSHEPAGFRADDLGFRLARGAASSAGGGTPW